MRKGYLLIAALIFFAACNTSEQNKPDADRVIKDTVANVLLKDFTAKPESSTFCAKVEPTDDGVLRRKSAELLSALRKLRNQPQHFSVNAAEDNTITAKQGTRFTLTKACFVNHKGQEITQTIDVQVKECYNLPDMMEEGLTTTSNNTILESKGMVSIMAFYKGEELKLKDGENINVRFPFDFAANSDYTFFYGHGEADDAFNWLPEDNLLAVDGPVEDINQSVAENNITPPSFSYKNVDLETYLREFVQYPEEARRNELSSKVDAVVQISPNGRVTNVLASSDYKVFRDDVSSQLMEMPKWTPAKHNGANIACSVRISMDFNIRRAEQVTITVHNDEVSYYYNSPSSVSENVASAGSKPSGDLYSRSFSHLGWFNCARFVESKSEKADVVVRSDENTDIKLVLKGHNSIINGENYIGYTRFRNVPVGSQVSIVGVNYNQSILNSYTQQLKLLKQNVISPQWQKASEAGIRKAYRNLSSV